MKLKVSKPHLIIGLAVAVAFILGHFLSPYIHRGYKYFSLRGYSRLTDYKLKPKQEGKIANFALLDSEGKGHELYRYADAKAIVIISQAVDCWLCKSYSYAISGIKKEYESRNVRFFLMNSHPGETRDQIAASKRTYPFQVPLLLDPAQVAWKELGLSRAPEAVVLDPRDWSVIYRGPIDDQVVTGFSPTPTQYLRLAIESFLHERPVKTFDQKWKACEIPAKTSPEAPNYVQHAGPIMVRKCLYCHSPAIGTKPFFADYNMVKGWTAMIKETVMTKRMPPWTWDIDLPQPYLLKHKLPLDNDETRVLLDWVAAGAPRGEGPDPLFRATRVWQKRKREIPKPDYEASNREVLVPPKGYNEYKFYQIDGPTKEDMWVVGTNLRSTNPKTVHHQMLIVASQPLEHYTSRVQARRDEELVEADETGTVPAWELHQMRMDNAINDTFIRIQISALGLTQPSFFSQLWGNKLGFLIPKGSYVILETHYHGTGKPEKEISTVGLYLHKGKEKLININSGRVSFTNYMEIPPHGREILVPADPIVLRKKSGLLALGLHMHMRGKSARYYATYPDGKVELIASHPIFNYTTSTARGITFAPTKIFPAGTSVHIECTYDNSAMNPFNPDPTKTVLWGQTLDRSEMCMGYLWTYDVPDGGDVGERQPATDIY